MHWERDDASGGATLAWIERGGPPVAGPPARIGFGSLLINANMRAQLAGRIERHWDPDGLRCILHLGREALAGGGWPAAGNGPLAGRRILLATDDPVGAPSLTIALRDAGGEVIGPAATPEEALLLLDAARGVDAAVLSGILAGRSAQPVAQLLRRRASAIIYLSELGVAAEDVAEATVLDAPVTATALREALVRALRPEWPRQSALG